MISYVIYHDNIRRQVDGRNIFWPGSDFASVYLCCQITDYGLIGVTFITSSDDLYYLPTSTSVLVVRLVDDIILRLVFIWRR